MKFRYKMRRGKKNKSIRAAVPVKKVLRFCFLVGGSLIVLGILTGKAVNFFLHNSSYFEIKNVTVADNHTFSEVEARKLCGLNKTQNIFEVNLSKIAKEIKGVHPEFSEVEVKREFPNKLIIVVKNRIPVAQIEFIRGKGYVFMDKEGFIIPPIQNVAQPKLPLIVGTELASRDLKTGKPIESVKIKAALSLMGEISSLESIKTYKVTTIDVRDYKNISFFIGENLEIKVGYGDFKTKIERLTKVLTQLETTHQTSQYIDLRFGDPIVK